MRRARRGLALAAVLLAAAFALATWRAHVTAEPHPYLQRLPEAPLVLAHQGGAGLWPPNTREAFEGAVALGADVLEIDVQRTRDGRLVVRHDDTVDRTTDGRGAIAGLTWPEIEALDAGHGWTPGGTGAFPYRDQGVGVPTLDAVVEAFPDVPLNVELKPDSPDVARQVCTTLEEAGRTRSVMVASFHGSALRAFRRACPEVATSATPNEALAFVLLSKARLAGPYRPPFDALQVPEAQGGLRVVTPSLLRAAAAKAVQVHVWTVNERAALERLVALGVDGLITDRPDRALEAAGRAVDAAALPPFLRP